MCWCGEQKTFCKQRKMFENAVTAAHCRCCFSRGKQKRKKSEVFVCTQDLNALKTETSIRKDLQLTEILGSGGFGSVYKGFLNGNKVAAKRIHVRERNPFAAIESIEAEAHGLSLSHPNIVQTLEIIHGQSISETFIIMEFAGNKNLQTMIDDDREVFCTQRRIKFATHIARGLEYIHAQNIVHLDIKPANIIVDSQDNCKIGDFGCSQILDGYGESSSASTPPSPTPSYLTGTFAYRAPELLKGENVSSKADIYSFGICLWQMLTREQPYGLESQFVVIFGVVAYHLRPTVPVEILKTAYTDLMQKLWAAAPDERPSATEVVQILSKDCTLKCV